MTAREMFKNLGYECLIISDDDLFYPAIVYYKVDIFNRYISFNLEDKTCEKWNRFSLKAESFTYEEIISIIYQYQELGWVSKESESENNEI